MYGGKKVRTGTGNRTYHPDGDLFLSILVARERRLPRFHNRMRWKTSISFACLHAQDNKMADVLTATI